MIEFKTKYAHTSFLIQFSAMAFGVLCMFLVAYVPLSASILEADGLDVSSIGGMNETSNSIGQLGQGGALAQRVDADEQCAMTRAFWQKSRVETRDFKACTCRQNLEVITDRRRLLCHFQSMN